MSVGAIMALVIAGLVLSIFFSTKFKVNGGILAMFAAWFIGCVCIGQKAGTLITYWPTSVMFILISTSLFFGVARQNGTLDLMAAKMLYKVKGATFLIPFMFFLVSFCVAAMGAGALPPQLFLSTIIFGMAGNLGVNPLLLMIASWGGACAGSSMFWAPEAASRIAFYSDSVGAEVGYSSCVVYALYGLVMQLVLIAIYYVVFRGWKTKGTVIMEKPADFNPTQKKTLTVLIGVILLIVVPALLNLALKTPMTKRLAAMFDVQFVCVLGFVVCLIMGLSDEKKIITSLPWNLILTIGGMCMLIKVAIEYNLPEILANFLVSSGLPNWMIPVMFLLIAAFISIFSNFSVIYPLLFPMIPMVCAATGINSLSLLIATSLGAVAAGFSPFSMGGACQISGCADPDLAASLVPKMILMGVCNAVILSVFGALGLFGLFPDPLL